MPSANRFSPRRARFFQAVLLFMLCAIMAAPAHAEKQLSPVEKAFFDTFSAVHQPAGKKFFPEMVYRDPDKKTRKLRVGKGEYVLLNVWATYCPPCLIELPSLDKLAARSKVRVLPVSVDTQYDHYRLEDFLKKRGLPAMALNLDHMNVILRQTPIRGLPTSFLLGPNREILYIFEGPADWASPEAVAFFNSLH